MMQKTKIAMALSVLSLVACGGGSSGSNSNTSSPSTTQSISGKVIDGYIGGAIVCLDVNSNNVCDGPTIDPQTTSAADGSYTISYVGDASNLHVIAYVPVGAVDQDLGEVKQAYTMAAPAVSAATITPITTLVTTTIRESGGQATHAEAEAAVQKSLGITAPILGYDFKKEGDVKMAKVAEVTASAIASATDTLKNDAAIKDAQLSSGKIAEKAAEQVKNSIVPQLVTNGATSETIDSAKTIATTVITSKVQNIVVETKSGDGSVVSIADAFRAGIVGLQTDTGDYINELGERINKQWNGYINAITAWTNKFDIDNPPTVDSEFERVLVGGKWFKRYDNSEDWTFNGTDWVLGKSLDNRSLQVKPTVDKNCLNVPSNDKGTVSQSICAVEKDLSNLKIASIFTGICKKDGQQISGCDENALFPAGSKGYDVTWTIKSSLVELGKYNGEFRLSANVGEVKDNGVWNGYCTSLTGDCNQAATATIENFIAYTKVWPQYRGAACNTPFKVLSYNSTTKRGTIGWATNADGGCSGGYNPSKFVAEETQEFEVVDIKGKDIFITPTPVTYRKGNPGNNQPYMIFGVQTSSKGIKGVWSGDFNPVDIKQSVPLNGDPEEGSQIMNRVAFNAILALRKIAAFPYPN